jgi:hypothetical protein
VRHNDLRKVKAPPMQSLSSPRTTRSDVLRVAFGRIASCFMYMYFKSYISMYKRDLL